MFWVLIETHLTHCLVEKYNFQLHTLIWRPGPEIIKLLLCSTQLIMKIQLLIKTKMLTIKYFFCFQTLRCSIYHAVGILTFMNRVNFMLSLVGHDFFINLRPGSLNDISVCVN